MVIGGIFLIVWIVVNFLLVGLYTRQACDEPGSCSTVYRLNLGALLATGVGVALYLLLASVFLSRHTLGRRFGHRGANGPEMATFRNVVEEMAITAGVVHAGVLRVARHGSRNALDLGWPAPRCRCGDRRPARSTGSARALQRSDRP